MWSKEHQTAQKFVHDWLWESAQDKNPYDGPWNGDQIKAIASMLLDYSRLQCITAPDECGDAECLKVAKYDG